MTKDDDNEGGKRTRTPPRNSTHGAGRETRRRADERRPGLLANVSLRVSSPALAPPVAHGSLPKHPAQLLVVPIRSLSPQPRHQNCTTARFAYGLWLLAEAPCAIARRPALAPPMALLSLDTGTAQPLASPVACGSLPKHPAQLLVVPSPQPRHPCCTTETCMRLLTQHEYAVNAQTMQRNIVGWAECEECFSFILAVHVCMRTENVDRIGLALAETVAQANNGPGQGDNPPLIPHPYMYCSVPSMLSHGLT
ncbi:hypothetical protein BU15DRAFT_67867 [Melanogaster broomeanus]|nr:hypothetical protein BU15DRAFT_67867 [Melanogaster broomeanus]